jgi:endothelin-converting enzyme
LDKIGSHPLLEVVGTVKSLLNEDLKSPIYKGPGRKYSVPSSEEEEDEPRKVTVDGLTAAIAYLHSRSVDVLFGFGIDGDAGLDPDMMTLQFSQGGTGLPSKVLNRLALWNKSNKKIQEYYDEEDIVKVYTETIATILLAIDEESSPSEQVSASTKSWHSVLNFGH